jgi:hypothetical protein
MSRAKRIPVLFLGGASVLTTLLAALLLASGLFGVNEAEATQPPPPPPSYTVAVGTSGGDSTCEVQILAPTETAWGSTASGTFTSGTGVDLQFRINCPSNYVFDHWESNNEDLDGQTSHGGHSGDFTIIENTTATAVFVPKFTKPVEHGIVLSGSAGASYGAAVRLIYENAAGWYIKETVVWAPSEPTGNSDCAPHGQITIQPNFILMPTCDLNGTPNASGAHGYIDDSIMNNNGPPWALLDAFVALGKAFPCSSTTLQTSHVKPPGSCHTTEFQYPHTQTVYLTNTDSNNGTARGWSSGVGGINTPWVRP